jgi:hypothetical protein
MFPNELRRLAERLGKSCPNNPGRLREVLEANLVPIIRVAIRSGAGLPWVVSWVRGHLPEPTPDPSRVAPGMARQMCDLLLGQPRTCAAAETVVGV